MEEEYSELEKLEKLEEDDVPKVNFSPAGRKLERKLTTLAINEIKNMDIPQEEKDFMREQCFDYLLSYENEYKRYYKTFKDFGLPPPGLM